VCRLCVEVQVSVLDLCRQCVPVNLQYSYLLGHEEKAETVIFHVHSELDVGINVIKVVQEHVELFFPVRPYHESVVHVPVTMGGFLGALLIACCSKYSI